MTTHCFLGILLGLATVELISSVGVCPGTEKVFRRPWSAKINPEYKLIFLKNGREKVIANATQSFDPSFGFRDKEPYIPEMSQKYEGEYYWRTTFMSRDSSTQLFVKDCSEDRSLKYGRELRLSVPSSAVVLEFQRNKNSPSVVLWSKLNAGVERGARGAVERGYWTVKRVTGADTGKYSFLSASDLASSVIRLQVQAVQDTFYEAGPEWILHIPIPLLEVKVMYGRMELFKDGLVKPEALKHFEGRIQLQATDTGSEFTLRSARPRDGGDYTFRDSSGQLAMAMILEGHYEEEYSHDENEHDPYGVIYPVTITLAVLMGLTCCCWGGCKLLNDDDEKKEVTAASPDAEPNTHFHEPLEMPGSRCSLASLQPRPNVPSSGNIEHYPPNPWANSPPPFLSSGSPSYNPVPQPPVSDPAPSSYQPPAPYVPYQPYVPEPVSSSPPPPYVPYVPYQPPVSDPAPSSYQPPAPYVPYQPPSEPTATAAGGAGDSSVPAAPTVDLESQFQPRGWGGAMDDFLSSSPLCMDSNTPEGTTYTSDKLTF